VSVLGWLWRRGRRLREDRAERLAQWRATPEHDDAAHGACQRFVVVDVESTGLNVFQDHLIAIGAVLVEGGRIMLDSSFYRVLRQTTASSHENILVHGIGGSEQTGGDDPELVLLDFLDFIGKCPLVGYHTHFDYIMIRRAMRSHLGESFRRNWIDLAFLAPALGLARQDRSMGLDDWLETFGITNYRRHDALADALATAQLFQVLLARAAATGDLRSAALARLAASQEWLSRQRG